MKKLFYNEVSQQASLHAGLLLRLAFGLSLGLFHGRAALVELLAGNIDFPDPLGIGSALTKAFMGVFAEFACALLVATGLLTRLACVPIVTGFLIAVFIHHAADDFGARNLSFLYLCGFAVILLTGPGRYSLDRVLFGKLRY